MLKIKLFHLLCLGTLSCLPVFVIAQDTSITPQKDKIEKCSLEKLKLPGSLSKETGGLGKYLEIVSLSENERPRAFSNLSNTDRATVLRLHLSSQFVRRPDMSEQQKDLILESLTSVSAENYNTQDPDREAKARILSQAFHARVVNSFSRKDAYEIFSSLSGDLNKLAFLQKYHLMLENDVMAARKKLFVDGPKEERSNMMRAQMVYYLATADLMPDQRRFFVKSIEAATPRAFVLPEDVSTTSPDERTNLIKLKDEAMKLFSKGEMFAYFMGLGIHKIDPEKEAGSALSPESVPTCTCNWYCAPCYACVVLNNSCNATKVGCGWQLLESCTSPCRFSWDDCF